MRFFWAVAAAALLALARCVSAEIRMINETIGGYFVFVVFDTKDLIGPVLMLGTSPPTPTVVGQIFLARASSSPAAPATVAAVVGRLVTAVSILTYPRGCDGPTSATSIENSNCVANGAEADAAYARLHELWYFSIYGENREFCINNGGDVRSCLGPFKIGTFNLDTFVVLEDPDDAQILFSMWQFLVGSFGVNSDVPVVTAIDLDPPLLIVDAPSCFYPPAPIYDFSSAYDAFYYDAYGGLLTDVPYAFVRDDGVGAQMRVLLRRVPAASFTNYTGVNAPPDQFTVQLADAVGTGLGAHYFNVWWESAVFTSVGSIPRTFQNVFGSPIVLTGTSGSCTAVFSLQNAPRPPQFLDPVSISISTYAEPENVAPLRAYFDRVCNFHVGAYDSNGFLKFPNTAELQVKGGYTVWARPVFPYTKESVEPSVGYAGYDLTCEQTYPKDYVFNGFSGTQYQRDAVAANSCLFPFLWNQPISDGGNPQEREQQCQRLGGVPFGRSQDACFRSLSFFPCRAGWIYYDEYCYFKFQDQTDTNFLVTETNQQQACDRIEPTVFPSGSVTPVLTLDAYQLQWISNWFSYWKIGAPNPHPYRVKSDVNAGSQCTCFYPSYLPYWMGGRSTAKPCVCQRPYYPLCRYHLSQYEVPGTYVSIHAVTLAILRDGQDTGTPFGGQTKRCECFPGSTGEACERDTCVTIEDLTPFTPGFNSSAPLPQPQQDFLRFWQRCLTDSKGECQEGRVNFCQCNAFYGPSASLTSLTIVNETVPCGCPASSNRNPSLYYEINGVVKQNTPGDYLVCDGAVNGACTYDFSSGLGVCVGALRRNTAPGALAAWEPKRGGVASTCPIPKIPTAGALQDPPNLIADVCSGRGTCCPISSPGRSSTLNSFTQNGLAAGGVAPQACQADGVVKNGCVCPAGTTGNACQCAGRNDVAAGIPVLVGSSVPNQNLRLGVAVVVLRQASPVFAVNSTAHLPDMQLSEQGCTVTAVQISTSVNGGFRNCTFVLVEGDGQWVCDGGYAGFVFVFTVEAVPWCGVQAYATPQTYVACGGVNHGSHFAQRFWAYEAYRAYGAFSETVEDQALAEAGCPVDYPCMCAPNYIGAGCNAGVSSVTISTTGTTTHSPCGYTTEPQRGYYLYSEITNEGACVCNPYTTSDFTGKSAGATGGAAGYFGYDACEIAFWANPDLGTTTPIACGGNGAPIAAQMIYGWCSFDLNDFQADPLSRPLSRKPGATANVYLQVFTAAQNIVVVRGRSWIFYDGQLAVLDKVVGNVGFSCLGVTSSTPVALGGSLSPESVALPPKPAIANVTVWTLGVSAACTTTPTQAATAGPTLAPTCFSTAHSTQICDPAVGATNFVYDTFGPVNPLPPSCAVTVWCSPQWIAAGQIDASQVPPGFSCLASAAWIVDTAPSRASQTLQYDVPFDFVIECATAESLQLSSSDNYENVKYGGLSCNRAVDRLVDWKLWEILGGTYKPQCFQWPITPYSYVLGAAYGLFYNQVPSMVWNDDDAYWPEANYAYLATLFNGYRCFGSTGLALQPVGDVEFDQYLTSLVNRSFSSLYTPNGTTAPLVFDHSQWTAQMLYAFGASFNSSSSPAQVDAKYAPALDSYVLQSVEAFFERLGGGVNPLADANLAWFINSVGSVELGSLVPDASVVTGDPQIIAYANLARDGTQQFTQDFVAATEPFARYYDPGVWQTVGGFVSANTLSVTFPANLSVFQVFNGDGSLCATVFNVVEKSTTTFTCSTGLANLTEVAANATQANLPYWTTHYWNLLWNETRSGPVPALMAPTLGAFIAGSLATAGTNLIFRSVPQNEPFWVTQNSPPFSVTPGFDALNAASPYRIDPAAIIPQQIANGTSFAQYWTFLENEIIIKHTWPTNYVYDALIAAANFSSGGGVTCRAIDPTKTLDKTFLRNFYYSVLAPRRCSSDQSCTDFRRGTETNPTCIFDSRSHIAWLNGSPDFPNEGGVGNEGGCACWANSTSGFRDLQSFCSQCTSGWGPANANEWAQVGLYQNAFASLLPNENPNSFLYDPAQFNGTTPFCQLPFDRGTDGLLCGGHGSLVFYSAETNATLETFLDGSQTPPALETPSCAALLVSGVELDLQPVVDFGALRYSSSASYVTVSIVNGESYFVDASPGGGNSQPFSLENCVRAPQSPWICDFVAFDDQATVLASGVRCLSPVLFDPTQHVDIVGYSFVFRDWSTTLTLLS